MNKKHVFVLLAACVLFVFLFNPSSLYFLSDDWDSLLFSLAPVNILHSFRPLSDASLLLDYNIWKMNAGGFHFTNYILHFSCVFCLYHLFKQLLLLRYNVDWATNLSLTGSLFFLFYPFHSEAIFWIVGRGAILCTLFGLLSLLFFIKKEQNRFYYLLSVLFFGMALLSYEQAWILPVFITILAFIFSTQAKTKRILQVSIFWTIFLVYLLGRFYFTQSVIGTPYGSERLMNFDILFLTRNFAAFVFRSFVLPLPSSVLFAGICVIVALLIAVLLFLHKKKIGFVFILSAAFYLLSLLPVLPLGIDTHDTESERFLYFPSVFFILMTIQFFGLAFEKKYKLVYVLLLLGLIPLWMSFKSFIVSSIVVKKTVTAVRQLSHIDTLYCQQLPGQYKGAFIFRNGFVSMIKLEKGDEIKNVEINSTSELFQPSKDYTIDCAQLNPNNNSYNAIIRWTEQKVILRK